VSTHRVSGAVLSIECPTLPIIRRIDDENGSISWSVTAIRSFLDGCGTAPDRSDWIVDCPSQMSVRSLIDLFFQNWGAYPLCRHRSQRNRMPLARRILP
jgi:hypothetical protein